MVVAGPDGPALSAFYTAAGPLDVHDLRAQLAQRLPAPLIPARLTELPELPHLPNGKLDRTALADTPASAQAVRADPPVTPSESAVAAVYAELTATATVGRHDDFFAARRPLAPSHPARVARCEARFGVDLPLASVFERPVVADLAGSRAPAARADPRGGRR